SGLDGPQVEGIESYAPILGIRGAFSWGIRWQLDKPAHPKRGGYIIQHVHRLLQDSDGKDLLPKFLPGQAASYYEAWRVEPGATAPSVSNSGPYAAAEIKLIQQEIAFKGNNTPEKQAFLIEMLNYLIASEAAIPKNTVVHDIYSSTGVRFKQGA